MGWFGSYVGVGVGLGGGSGLAVSVGVGSGDGGGEADAGGSGAIVAGWDVDGATIGGIAPGTDDAIARVVAGGTAALGKPVSEATPGLALPQPVIRIAAARAAARKFRATCPLSVLRRLTVKPAGHIAASANMDA